MITHSCAQSTNSTLESNSWNVTGRHMRIAALVQSFMPCLSEAVEDVLQAVDAFFKIDI